MSGAWRHTILTLVVCAASARFADPVDAAYPVLSRFTTTYDGAYQPQVRRYVVVDPVPAQGPAVSKHAHGHHGPPELLWRRADVAVPTYPYGWFGARHATECWSRGSYYDDYRDHSVLRGR